MTYEQVFDCAPDCDERDTCAVAGTPGHTMCGHCDTHNRPMHHCGIECWGD